MLSIEDNGLLQSAKYLPYKYHILAAYYAKS